MDGWMDGKMADLLGLYALGWLREKFSRVHARACLTANLRHNTPVATNLVLGAFQFFFFFVVPNCMPCGFVVAVCACA